MEKKSKVYYIEYLRVISMIAVVFNHIASTAATDFTEAYMYTWEGMFLASSVNLLHFAVPIFFMISGALLLDPKKELPLKKLIKNYILKYAFILLTFGWGYAFVEEVFKYKNIRLSYFINSFLNMLQGKTWAHMWYMYSLLGVMLCVPILRVLVKYFSKEEVRYICVVSFVFVSALPLFTYITDYQFGVSFVMGNIYCFYMLLGYWIENEIIRISNNIAKMLFVFMIPILVFVAYVKVMWSYDLGIQGYSSPFIIIYSVAFFSIIREKYKEHIFKEKFKDKAVSFWAKVSFGVYLTHMFWINLLFKFFNISPFEPNVFAGFFGIGMLVLCVSGVTVWLLKKLPIIKRLI